MLHLIVSSFIDFFIDCKDSHLIGLIVLIIKATFNHHKQYAKPTENLLKGVARREGGGGFLGCQ